MRGLLTFGLTIFIGASAAQADPAARDIKLERRDGKVVYVAPPIVIEGKVQRPAAMFVLPPPKISYPWPDLERPRPAPQPQPPAPEQH